MTSIDQLQGSRGLQCGDGEVHQLWVPADKPYTEPGGFRCGTQAVAFDVGLSGFLPARIPLRVEPQGDESSLQLGDGRRETGAGVRLLLPATLVALERLRPLSRAFSTEDALRPGDARPRGRAQHRLASAGPSADHHASSA